MNVNPWPFDCGPEYLRTLLTWDPSLKQFGAAIFLVSCAPLALILFQKFISSQGGFLKCWYPTTMGFPTKNDHFGVFWGYHDLRKHPYVHPIKAVYLCHSHYPSIFTHTCCFGQKPDNEDANVFRFQERIKLSASI